MFFQVKPCILLSNSFDISPQMCYIIQLSSFHNKSFAKCLYSYCAGVVKSVDALDSKSSGP